MGPLLKHRTFSKAEKVQPKFLEMSEPQDPESENTQMVPLEDREILMSQREEGKGKLGIIAICFLAVCYGHLVGSF